MRNASLLTISILMAISSATLAGPLEGKSRSEETRSKEEVSKNRESTRAQNEQTKAQSLVEELVALTDGRVSASEMNAALNNSLVGESIMTIGKDLLNLKANLKNLKNHGDLPYSSNPAWFKGRVLKIIPQFIASASRISRSESAQRTAFLEEFKMVSEIINSRTVVTDELNNQELHLKIMERANKIRRGEMTGDEAFAQAKQISSNGDSNSSASEVILTQNQKYSYVNGKNKAAEIYKDDNNRLYIEDKKGNIHILEGQYAGLYAEEVSADASRVMIGSRAYSAELGPVLEHPTNDYMRKSPGVRVIDVKSGKIIATFEEAGTNSELSGDGKFFVEGRYDSKVVKVYEVDSKKLLHTFKGNLTEFNPNNQSLLLRGLIYDSLVDLKTGQTLLRFFTRGQSFFSPSGNSIFYVNGTNVTELSTQTGKVIFKTELPKYANQRTNRSSMRFAQGEKIIAINYKDYSADVNNEDKTMLINRETGKSMILPHSYDSHVTLSNNGRLISTSYVFDLAVYDTTTFEKIYSFNAQKSDVVPRISYAKFQNNDQELVIQGEKNALQVTLPLQQD